MCKRNVSKSTIFLPGLIFMSFVLFLFSEYSKIGDLSFAELNGVSEGFFAVPVYSKSTWSLPKIGIV